MSSAERQLILSRLATMTRDPFREALAQVMAVPPTDEALGEWSSRNPLAWSQAISILAGLAGYRSEDARRSITVHAHGGASVSIGVGADGRIIDTDAYRAALIRELGPEVAHAMLARLPHAPVTLEHAPPGAVPAPDAPEDGS